MAIKTANLYARIEPEVKEEAEQILSSLGISISGAINMFYKQIILNQGIPFEVKLPTEHPLNITNMTKEQLGQEIEKGIQDMLEGKVSPANEVFEEFRSKYEK